MSNFSNSLTEEDKKIIYDFKNRNKKVCYYCKKNIVSKEDVTVDHKTPLARGGKTEEANLAISCLRCNFEKDCMTEEEYRIFKHNQSNLNVTTEVTELLCELMKVYNNIRERASIVNAQYNNTESIIKRLENQISNSNFNASEGYLFAKKLKENIKEREKQIVLKKTYNILNAFICNTQKQLNTINDKVSKIIHSQLNNEIKNSCINHGK